MLDGLVVAPGSAADLERRDPRDTLGLPEKENAKARLGALLEELSSLQERLYAEGRRSVLLVLQGLDASGKDGTIRRVFTGVNPQGCIVTSFKTPTPIELAHDFLWRVHAQCPARGMIGIFNRSHLDGLGSLVRDPSRPQLGAQPRGRDRARRGPTTTRSAVPRPSTGLTRESAHSRGRRSWSAPSGRGLRKWS